MDKDDLGGEVDMSNVLGIDNDVELTIMVSDPDEEPPEPLLVGLMLDTYPIAAPDINEVEATPLTIGLTLEQAEALYRNLASIIAEAKEIERNEAKGENVTLN